MMGNIFHRRIRFAFYIILSGISLLISLWFLRSLYLKWAPERLVKRVFQEYQISYPDLNFSISDYKVNFSNQYEVLLKDLVLSYKNRPIFEVDHMVIRRSYLSLLRKEESFKGRANHIFTYSQNHFFAERELNKIFSSIVKSKNWEFSWKKWEHFWGENKELKSEKGRIFRRKGLKGELGLFSRISFQSGPVFLKGYLQSFWDLEQWLRTGHLWAMTELKLEKFSFGDIESVNNLGENLALKTLIGKNGDFKWELEANNGRAFKGRLKGDLLKSEARVESLGFYIYPHSLARAMGRVNPEGSILLSGTWNFHMKNKEFISSLKGTVNNLFWYGSTVDGEINFSDMISYGFLLSYQGLSLRTDGVLNYGESIWKNSRLIIKPENKNSQITPPNLDWIGKKIKKFFKGGSVLKYNSIDLMDIPVGPFKVQGKLESKMGVFRVDNGQCRLELIDSFEASCESVPISILSHFYDWPWGHGKGLVSFKMSCHQSGRCSLEGSSKEVQMNLFSINPELRKRGKRTYKEDRFSSFSFEWNKEALLSLSLKNRVYNITGKNTKDGLLLNVQGEDLLYILENKKWIFKGK